MNRIEFMTELAALLQDVPEEERRDAMKYYNDYFDDAGEENEKEVIEALGNPARVAENIRRDLLDNGYGKKPAGKAKASDRALMEYGQSEQESEADEGQGAGLKESATVRGAGRAGQTADFAPKDSGSFRQESAGEASAAGGWNPFEGYGKSTDGAPLDEDAYRWSRDTAGWFGNEAERERKAVCLSGQSH